MQAGRSCGRGRLTNKHCFGRRPRDRKRRPRRPGSKESRSSNRHLGRPCRQQTQRNKDPCRHMCEYFYDYKKNSSSSVEFMLECEFSKLGGKLNLFKFDLILNSYIS